MILLRRDKVCAWIDSIEKDQNWLATEMGLKKSYLSLVMHNRTKISRRVMDHLTTLSHISFESLFLVTDVVDDREFYGKDIFFQNKMMRSPEYNSTIDKILADNPPKNGKHNGQEKV